MNIPIEAQEALEAMAIVKRMRKRGWRYLTMHYTPNSGRWSYNVIVSTTRHSINVNAPTSLAACRDVERQWKERNRQQKGQ
jgi:acetolactate synthase regulatory subunit